MAVLSGMLVGAIAPHCRSASNAREAHTTKRRLMSRQLLRVARGLLIGRLLNTLSS